MATYESKKYAAIPVAATQIADGSVSNSEYQFINSLSSNAQTQITALDTAKLNLAGGTLTGNLTLADNVHAYFGAGQDIDILSDGTIGYIKANDLRLQSSTGENYVTAAVNGAANLWYDNANKLQTTSGGANVTGTLVATTFSGSGASLTSLPAGNLTGTVADARISTLTASKLTGALPAIDGSNLTGIDIAPSTATSVGALKYFAIYYKNSGGSSNSVTIGVGTEITPSTYASGNMYVTSTGLEYKRTGGTAGQLNTSSLGYIIPGFAGTGSSIINKTRATETGTWRCISQATYSAFNTTGQNGGSYVVSGGGLFQRVS